MRRELGPKADHAEVLSELAAWFRRHKLECARKKRALETSVDEQQKRLASVGAGGEVLAQLRVQLERATKWEQTKFFRGRREELRAKREMLESSMTPYRQWQADFETRQAERELARAATQEREADLKREHKALAEALAESAENLAGGRWFLRNLDRVQTDSTGHGPCLMCGHTFDPAVVRAQAAPRVATRVGLHQALVANAEALDERIRQMRAASQVQEDEWTKVDYDQARLTQELEGELGRLDAALEENAKVLVGVPDAYEEMTANEIRARVAALEGFERAHQQVEAEAKALREHALEEQQSKTLEQAAAGALAELLRRTSETANAAVNAYMPEGFSAQLDLEDAKWTVLGTDKKAHKLKVMSGAECGALVPSLACAWTEGAPGRFLLLDDEDFAGFDRENLALLLSALKDAVEEGLLTQVFLAWSRPDEVPEDWGQRIMVQREEADAEPNAQLELPFDRPAPAVATPATVTPATATPAAQDAPAAATAATNATLAPNGDPITDPTLIRERIKVDFLL